MSIITTIIITIVGGGVAVFSNFIVYKLFQVFKPQLESIFSKASL